MTALPNLANYREQPGFRWTESDYRSCDGCGGSGILFNNAGPSGLHHRCGECDGAGRWPVEAE